MLFLRFSVLLHTCPFGHVLFLHQRAQQSGRVTHRQSIRIYRSTNFLGPLSSAYPIRRAHSPQLFPSRYRSRSARRVMESETLSIHCRTMSRSSLALGLNGLQPIPCRVQCIPAKQTANAVSLLDPLVVPRLPRKPFSFFFQFTDQTFHLF